MKRLNRTHSYTAVITTLLLLCGAAYQRATKPKGEDARPYLTSVRDAADALPMRVGNWMGRNVGLPTAAVTLLRPNVLMCREYVDLLTGSRAKFLLVHCGDARDMQGHYPPVCYANSGWRQVHQEPGFWHAGSLVVPGMEYEFEGRPLSGQNSIIVMNAMLLPEGKIVSDMAAVRQRSAESRSRLWGAGQIQIIVDGSVPSPDREETVNSLLSAHEALLRVILSGDRAKPATQPAK